jgi:anti-sigma regulatory factor (Ser/Thr protein kinase)
VASELVTNAAIHAHTMMTIQVSLRPCHVRIAVFDGSDRPAVAGPAGLSGGGRGLRLVEAVSGAWGSTALPDGKVVWAALNRGSH